MNIVGHVIPTARSAAFRDDELDGPGLAALMLPDYVLCHDWGYRGCFDGPPRSLTDRFVRAHMLADWYVHFGDSRRRERRGWAYRRMGIFARRYEEFFAAAAAAGLRPDATPTDSRRGFAHSMVELTVDTWLALNGDYDAWFDDSVAYFAALGLDGTPTSRAWIADAIAALGIDEQGDLDVELDVTRRRFAAARSPEELAYRGLAHKFGLTDQQASIDLVEDFMTHGMRDIPDAELAQVVDETAAFVGRELAAAGMAPAAGGEG